MDYVDEVWMVHGKKVEDVLLVAGRIENVGLMKRMRLFTGRVVLDAMSSDSKSDGSS